MGLSDILPEHLRDALQSIGRIGTWKDFKDAVKKYKDDAPALHALYQGAEMSTTSSHYDFLDAVSVEEERRKKTVLASDALAEAERKKLPPHEADSLRMEIFNLNARIKSLEEKLAEKAEETPEPEKREQSKNRPGGLDIA